MTDGDDYKVFHAMRTAIRLLTQGCNMGIVCHSHSQSQAVSQHGAQRYHTLPRQVGSILYTTSNRARTWGTYTHRTDHLVASILLYQCYHLLAQCYHKVVYIVIISGQEVILCHDFTSNINYSIGSTVYSYIDTYYTCFNFIYTLCHNYSLFTIHLNNEYSLTSHARTLAPNTSFATLSSSEIKNLVLPQVLWNT